MYYKNYRTIQVVKLRFIVIFKCAASKPVYNHGFTPLQKKVLDAPSGTQDRRMLFREVIAVLYQIRTKHVHTHTMWTLFKDFNVKHGGTCTNHFYMITLRNFVVPTRSVW